MAKKEIFQVIGCMSGTSVDGIDLALLETDGFEHCKLIKTETYQYKDSERETIKTSFGVSDLKDERVQAAIDTVTDCHIRALKSFDQQADFVGFHGQTIFHAPKDGLTVQIGDAARISKEIGIPVIHDFRSADVAAGGEGAPLLPLYHQARARTLDGPVAILNIGGVANVTWINGDDVIAFDTGPGNALMDDHMIKMIGKPFDKDGQLGLEGTVDEARLNEWLENMYFQVVPPKSLDRDAFIACDASDMSVEDAMATLGAFTAHSIAKAESFFTGDVKTWYVTGGGRYNISVMKKLNELVKGKLRPVEELGWNGDSLEAEGFAYLAVRSKLGLPLSLPTTTGCKDPISGGKIALPS